MVVTLAVLVACVAPLGPTSGAVAEPASTEDRIREIREQIGEASVEEAAAIVALEDVRARRGSLDAAVQALDLEVLAATSRLDEARSRVDRSTARFVAMTARLDATEQRLRGARERFNEGVATLYRTRGGVESSYTVLMLDSSEPREMYAGAQYLEGVTDARWSAVEELGALREEIERLKAEAEQRRADAESARAEADAQMVRLEGLRAEQAARRDDVAAEQAEEERLVEEIRSRVSEYEAELASLQATSSAIGSMLATEQEGEPLAGSFVVVRPVPGEITSGFGERVHPILGTVRMHNGVDMHADYGTPIKAGAAGEVVWAGWREGYGNTVIIDHGNQYATLYAHQSVVHVGLGETVSAGQTVGEVGSTGLSTGPHLHFEVRLLGVPVDPVPHL